VRSCLAPSAARTGFAPAKDSPLDFEGYAVKGPRNVEAPLSGRMEFKFLTRLRKKKFPAERLKDWL